MSSTPVDATGVSGGWVTDTLCSEEATVSQTPESSKVLVGAQRGRCAGSIGSAFFGLAQFQVSLTSVCSLDGIHAGAQARLFQEESPAFMGVRRTLPVLVLTHDGFGILPALNDFNHSCGDVGSNVMADEDVGRFRIVVGQRILRDAVGFWLIKDRAGCPSWTFQFSDGHTLRARVCA